ncbi:MULTISPECIES: IS1-like element ISArma2 family transposase [Limnospira]|uniref:IS1-like element ISArma2 family transposase n=1 Tax=Limnospira TaxID=2596745 RepID=UPI000A2EFD72|nr:IS1-like element ISArma2 family transposase [Limnospira indica]QJB29635.1 IS1 family transposase [Limnospira fusiformis SAG 85.79]QNH60155.1 MAG: IS1 family transposase [Limnospira indica BM01]
MNCPYCQSHKVVKNGHRQGKQSYLCRECGRQFRENPCPGGYSSDVKELCVKMSLNGMGFRAIERVTGISHNTILNWVRVAETHIDEANYEIPEIAQIDELQTFVGSKKTIWVWTVVNTKLPGILKFVIGDRSLLTFTTLWQMIQGWAGFLYITDGYKVYPCLIEDCNHLVSKTAMTRVEGENCRLRHYLARLHRKTLCDSKSTEMLYKSIRLLIYYLKHGQLPPFS